MILFNTIEEATGVTLFDYQRRAMLNAAQQQGPSQRLCLYYKTGAGKSLTALGCMMLWGHEEVLVVSPPSTHSQWTDLGIKLGVDVETMSHAKFRMKDTKLSRSKPIIADEMHLFGGHAGHGWRKLDKLALHLKAPLILASATPNYNDAERVYCIQHILDPHGTKGGYISFVYQHCETKENPFARTPEVLGFRLYPDAASYLAALPKVEYLPDDLVYGINDHLISRMPTPELDTFGFNVRTDRIVASQMEERHARINLYLIDDYGSLDATAYRMVKRLIDASETPVLVFSTHATVAEALSVSLHRDHVVHGLVTGNMNSKSKAATIDLFRRNQLRVLVGTASLATGTDGLDRVSDTLIILDDTDDDSLRRQLIGRIMPRGTSSNIADKSVHRVVVQ